MWPALRWTLTVAVAALVLAVSSATVARSAAAFLVLEAPLEPAAAIVVLAGETPLRESEAAAIYHDGWAPVVVIVAEPGEVLADVRWQALLNLGVPAGAVLKIDGHANNTREELTLAAQALQGGHEPVILVSSKYHARRLLTTWDRVTAGGGHGIVRVARLDPFDPEHWWDAAPMRSKVLHEYLGLLQFVAS